MNQRSVLQGFGLCVGGVPGLAEILKSRCPRFYIEKPRYIFRNSEKSVAHICKVHTR